ncbi:hypothetical protein DRQ09_03180, partial [candidate division KSB1 bacterium]
VPLNKKTHNLLKEYFLNRREIFNLFKNISRSTPEKLFSDVKDGKKDNVMDIINKLVNLYKDFKQGLGKEFEANYIYVPFPVVSENRVDLGEMFIFQERKSSLKDKNGPKRIVFLLYFEDTGILKISVTLKELSGVTITFESKNNRFLDEFKKCENELKDSLREKGLVIEGIFYRKIEDEERAISSIYTEFIFKSYQKVDIKV